MKDKNQAQGKKYRLIRQASLDQASFDKASFDKAQDRLRGRAEELLAGKPASLDKLSTTDIPKVIHELQVYQIELEMQNEELRRAQSELEESRNKYADLYDFAPVGYFTLDEKALILEVNLTGAALLGVERNYLINQLFSRYIDRESSDMFYLYRKQLLETKVQQTCELKMLRKDGTPFYVQLGGVAVFDSEGDFSRFRFAMLDITEHKKAKQALRVREEQYKNLFDNIPTGVYCTTPDGRILMANSALIQMLGYSFF
jgi:PAS domain S-box